MVKMLTAKAVALGANECFPEALALRSRIDNLAQEKSAKEGEHNRRVSAARERLEGIGKLGEAIVKVEVVRDGRSRCAAADDGRVAQGAAGVRVGRAARVPDAAGVSRAAGALRAVPVAGADSGGCRVRLCEQLGHDHAGGVRAEEDAADVGAPFLKQHFPLIAGMVPGTPAFNSLAAQFADSVAHGESGAKKKRPISGGGAKGSRECQYLPWHLDRKSVV